MSGKIFINYRREDAQDAAARVHRELAPAFGAKTLFMDVDNLLAGQRFDKELAKALGACDVFLAVIGPRWLAVLDERKASGERDFVREEIAAALKREIPVIPVLVNGARLPREAELPAEIADLVKHQKHDVRHEHFGRDMGPLIGAIKVLRRGAGGGGSPWRGIGAGVVVAAVAAAGTAWWYLGPNPAPPPKPEPAASTAPVKPDQATVIALAEAKAHPKPGTAFHDDGCPGGCPEMMALPQGKYLRGSPTTEEGRSSDEGPQKAVSIKYDLAVGQYEITRDQFEAFVQDAANNNGFKVASECYVWTGTEFKSQAGSFRKPGFDQGGDHPAVCINWDDATAYAARLAKVTGKPYRLLTEAEWEYAARGVTEATPQPPYPFGNDAKDLCAYANGADQTARAKFKDWTWANDACKDGYVFTAPVGSLKPNAFGVYDLLGNAREWVQDCYAESYDKAPTDGTSPKDAPTDCRRVVRGGSWYGIPDDLRSAGRIWYTADNRVNPLGFRVGRTF